LEPLNPHDDSYISSEEEDFEPTPKKSPKRDSILKIETKVKKPLNSYQKAMLKKKGIKR